MTNAAETLRKRLSAEIDAGKISKAELCRRTGFSKSQLDSYLSGANIPGLDAVQRAATAIGKEPWQLIGPEEPPKPAASPTVESLLAVIQQQEKRIQELQARGKGLTDIRRDFLDAAALLDDPELRPFLKSIRAYLDAKSPLKLRDKAGKSS